MRDTEYPYFMCAKCISMLRNIGEFKEMLRSSDMFWKKYVKKEPSNNDPLIAIDDGNISEQFYFESFRHDQEADDMSSDALKLENDDSDVEMKCMELFNQDFVNTNTTTIVDLKIEKCCDICDEGKNSIFFTFIIQIILPIFVFQSSLARRYLKST